ncbi:MAG: hypothetical protein JNK92_06520 [Dechloromonas sp.]|nr:hypothetical protein [Dechloromonas sp.]
MTPEVFIAHWKSNTATERAGAQQHFSDLCDLLGVDKPRDPDNYCFERGAGKSSGGNGWADSSTEMPDDEILRRLLALNLERAQA